jgi:uncharacterized coiled-coil protein SlyX
VTDIELERSQYVGRTSTPEIGAYVSVGNKFVDVVKLSDPESKAAIPLTNRSDKVQLILKFMDKDEVKIGSISIPVELFMPINENQSYSQWVTLFDYLEDDEYDGDVGVDDEEKPRVLIEYVLNPVEAARTPQVTTTTTREEVKTGGRVITNTRTTTTTYSSKYGSDKPETSQRTATQSSTIPKPSYTRVEQVQPISEGLSHSREDSEKYAVKTLRGDLYGHLGQLKDSLNRQQFSIFIEEDDRNKTLSNLEALHRELEGEHVQDKITGFQLDRLDQDITNDYDIRKDGFGQQKNAIKSTTDDVVTAQGQTEKQHASLLAENHKVGKVAAQQENIKANGLTETSKADRALNAGLRKGITDNNRTLGAEKDQTRDLMKKHDDVITAYDQTINKYHALLHKVEESRKDSEHESNIIRGNISNENYNTVVLNKGISHRVEAIANLSVSAKQLDSQLKQLGGKYQSFIKDLSKIGGDQTKAIQDLQAQLNNQGNRIGDLTKEVQTQVQTISNLHTEVDHANAETLNNKLRQLIDRLVVADSKRRGAQDELEDDQTHWSIKLRLFVDEASRRSREVANEKRINEVHSHISKIDKLTREIYDLYNQYEALQARVFTDLNRDEVNQNLHKEMEGIRLKIRWATEERKLTHSELEILLRVLRDEDIREVQESDIQSLKDELNLLRTELREKITIIRELESEIVLADKEIDYLTGEIEKLDRIIQELEEAIDQKNREIDELNRILTQRNARINQLQKVLGKSTTKFAAVKGDLVDQMLADYLSIAGCLVPVKRLGGGFYLFGTRKIFAKIMNGKLVVRVGGGYMVIDEFIATYSEPEIKKLEKLCEREGVESFYDLDLEAITGITGDKSPGSKSPKNRSFKGIISDAAMSGSLRDKKLTVTQIATAKRA